MDPYGLRVDLFKNYIGRIDVLMGADGCQKDFYEFSSAPIWAYIAPACGSYGPRCGPMWILAARKHPSEIVSPGSIDRLVTSDVGRLVRPDVRHLVTPDVRHLITPDVRHLVKPDVRHLVTSDVGRLVTPDVRHLVTPDFRHLVTPDANVHGHLLNSNSLKVEVFLGWGCLFALI